MTVESKMETRQVKVKLSQLEWTAGESAAKQQANRARFWNNIKMLVVDHPELSAKEFMRLIRTGMEKDEGLHDRTLEWHLTVMSSENFGKYCKGKCDDDEQLAKNRFVVGQEVPELLIMLSKHLFEEMRWMPHSEELVLSKFKDWMAERRPNQTVRDYFTTLKSSAAALHGEIARLGPGSTVSEAIDLLSGLVLFTGAKLTAEQLIAARTMLKDGHEACGLDSVARAVTQVSELIVEPVGGTSSMDPLEVNWAECDLEEFDDGGEIGVFAVHNGRRQRVC